ncbi:MAG: pirin family protein [Candidatus Aenigmarchaeota archaeon]|nr:pirin family protein [Candidatus Aenigmarchaeota archaeon]
MIAVRKSQDRGHFDHGWLETYHTFSFADHHDPNHMAFRTLRVINEDYVKPGEGFPTHSHRDMEIITFILEGALEHKDSMGNTSIIKPGEIQRMTAGIGVTHSEFNPSKKEMVHLLQIWIFPDQKGYEPSYEQKVIEPKKKIDRLALIASPDLRDGSVKVHQDVFVYTASLGKDKNLTYKPDSGRGIWIQVVKGELWLNGDVLKQGDGASITDEKLLKLNANHEAEFLLFDLA